MDDYNMSTSEETIKYEFIRNEIISLNGLLLNPTLPDNYRGAYYELKDMFCEMLKKYAEEIVSEKKVPSLEYRKKQ